MPRIAASACLTGQAVRYDGGDRYHGTVARVLRRWVRLQEYCPEVAIGLGVPRPPIQLTDTADGLRVLGTTDVSKDYTHALRGFADTVPDSICGAVLKARSPSCGVDDTPIALASVSVSVSASATHTALASGAFAHRLRERLPLLPMISETQLARAADVEGFVLKVYCYRQHKRWGNGTWLDDALAHIDAWPAAVRLPLADYLTRLRG